MICKKIIGGEMEIYPSDFSKQGNKSAWPDFGKKSIVRCDVGRSAFRLALMNWKQRTRGRGRIWLPYYLCQSMLQAAINEGVPYVQYHEQPFADPPKPDELDLVVIVHYFGMLNRAALDWLHSYTSRDWFVLEDCVQAAYTDGVGVVGDYAISSLRKWWPVPDGALLCSNQNLLITVVTPSDEEFVGQRLAAQLLRGTGNGENLYLDWIKTSEAKLENSAPKAPSWLSQHLLSGVDVTECLTRRLINWSFLSNCLASGLEDILGISRLYQTLPIGVVPLTFPVRVDNNRRDQLRVWLSKQGIFCPIHWELPDSVPEAALKLSNKILSFPIDQRYNEEDMARLATTLTDFAKK